jgi:hypothetical protein
MQSSVGRSLVKSALDQTERALPMARALAISWAAQSKLAISSLKPQMEFLLHFGYLLHPRTSFGHIADSSVNPVVMPAKSTPPSNQSPNALFTDFQSFASTVTGMRSFRHSSAARSRALSASES